MFSYDSLLSKINAERFAYYVDQAAPPGENTDITLQFFNDRITKEDIVKILQSETKVNQVLEPSAFDANPTYRDRGVIHEDYMKLFFFRESMYLNESDAARFADILTLASDTRDSDLLLFAKDYFDDSYNLISGARLQSERMRASLLSTGSFTVKSKNQSLEYSSSFITDDWEAKSLFKLTGTDAWKEENANTMDPIRDIASIIDAKRDQGVIVSHLVMTRKTLSLILFSTKIQKQLETLGYIGTDDVKKYIESRLNVTIHLYDKVFKDTDGKEKAMFKTGVITFLPDKYIGSTFYTSTPEQKFKKIAFDVNANPYITHSVIAPNISVRVGFEPIGSNPLRLSTTVSQYVAPVVSDRKGVTILEIDSEG